MKRLVSALAVGCLLLGLAPTALAAGPTRHFERVDRSLAKIDPVVPATSSPTPSARSRSSSSSRPSRPWSSPATTPTRSGARADAARDPGHGSTRGSSALGGKVLHRYQYAYNGIKVRATGAQLGRAGGDAAASSACGASRRTTADNIKAVPYVGAPTAWQTSGATGAGQTIAVIDSGIDYTHANFGGPGTPEAYDANDPTDHRGRHVPDRQGHRRLRLRRQRLRRGAATLGSTTPTPDPDPLDCGDHGSHVAGTAAGQGVLADHSTYTGPYDTSIYSDPDAFVVGPGVAPEAKLIALKVFGCEGSTGPRRRRPRVGRRRTTSRTPTASTS